MSDRAIVNLPLSKRGAGSLDRQIDRALAEQRRESRERERRYAEERKRVAELRKRIAALPDDALVNVAKMAALSIPEARRKLRRMAASMPQTVDQFLAKKEAPRA